MRNFTRKEIVPHLGRLGAGRRGAPRAAPQGRGLGLLGIGFPEEVGGEGGDLIDSIVVTEEIIQSGGSSGLIAALFTHGIALPHIVGSRQPGPDRPVRAADPAAAS